MNCSLQWLDRQTFIKEQEEDYGQLQEETQEPKASQFRNLLLQIAHISKIQSDGLNERDYDDDCDQDELVVIWQDWVLERGRK